MFSVFQQARRRAGAQRLSVLGLLRQAPEAVVLAVGV
jgi:hypothetical protein